MDDTADGEDTGLDWTNAYVDLQSALNDEGCTRIEVAEGTYYPTSGLDRYATFQLPRGVEIYGGYRVGVEERNPNWYPTILSGDLGFYGIWTDNSYHIVTGIGVDASAVLDGFIIEEGNANGTVSFDRGGGYI